MDDKQIQEIIDTLKSFQGEKINLRTSYSDQGFNCETKYVWDDPQDYVLEEAINIIRKQISKSPIECSYYCICPTCDKHMFPPYDMDYCSCGQKLNWS